MIGNINKSAIWKNLFFINRSEVLNYQSLIIIVLLIKSQSIYREIRCIFRSGKIAWFSDVHAQKVSILGKSWAKKLLPHSPTPPLLKKRLFQPNS
ncbi:hypothetical protein AFK68_03960 [Hydrocoleum sp. CS-953]|nr:hypothetical protein AFK68_03960 [Hydrocoleum sp. CS-953]